jgi:hypothetical protein
MWLAIQIKSLLRADHLMAGQAIITAGFVWFICLMYALRFSWVDGSYFVRKLVGLAAPLGFAALVILGGCVLAD